MESTFNMILHVYAVVGTFYTFENILNVNYKKLLIQMFSQLSCPYIWQSFTNAFLFQPPMLRCTWLMANIA